MMNPTITKQLRRIKALGTDGFGICENNSTFKIPFSLEGEAVQVEDASFSKNPEWGKIINIAERSSHRVQPECPHFTSCGGCVLQHLDEKLYRNFKKNIIKKYLKEFNVIIPHIKEPVIIGSRKRRRADYKAGYGREGFRLGFTAFKGTYINDMDCCPAIHQDLESLIPDLKAILKDLLVPYERVHIFQTRADNGIDLLISGFKRPLSCVEISSLQEMAAHHPICRLRIKVGKKYHNLVQKEEPKIQFGNTHVPVSCNSFVQASKESDQILGELVLKSIGRYHTPQRIADLFCGRGTLTFPIIEAGYKVDGFECDIHALTALASLSLPEDLIKIQTRNLFINPLTPEELEQYDHIVMNPPRAGAEAQSKELAKSEVKKLTYVSCSPETFARDASILTNSAYTLETIVPVDQFIWTPHVEVVATFSKKAHAYHKTKVVKL